VEEIAARHNVSIELLKPGSSQGLSTAAATERLAENGPNILSPPKQISPFMKFFHCLTSLFNLLLILAGVLNYILLAVDPVANKVNVSFSMALRGGKRCFRPSFFDSHYRMRVFVYGIRFIPKMTNNHFLLLFLRD
jgi:magnesium-transporting ATPase (P-type)